MATGRGGKGHQWKASSLPGGFHELEKEGFESMYILYLRGGGGAVEVWRWWR